MIYQITIIESKVGYLCFVSGCFCINSRHFNIKWNSISQFTTFLSSSESLVPPNWALASAGVNQFIRFIKRYESEEQFIHKSDTTSYQWLLPSFFVDLNKSKCIFFSDEKVEITPENMKLIDDLIFFDVYTFIVVILHNIKYITYKFMK